MKPWDLRVGRWQTALSDVERVDAVIVDPPYGLRTHAGNQGMGERFNATGGKPVVKSDGTTRMGPATRQDLHYGHWTPADVQEFVAYWSPRCTGWMACMTSDDLIATWREAYAIAGRLDFAPVPCIQHRLRLTGDGPGSGTVYLMVARPRRKEFLSYGSLPCFYGPLMAPANRTSEHIGGKPLSWMRAIIRDPTAGLATTLIAACQEGRRAIGSEMDPTTANRAVQRILRTNLAPPLFVDRSRADQLSLDTHNQPV